ncbi:MAG: glycine cleavage system aminomethyltransferase GcvT [Nitrospirae bacterium]|nr:MAG: glycine cleavage system aminomethyltransferase GcvT [Nitrospirota bacterium]
MNAPLRTQDLQHGCLGRNEHPCLSTPYLHGRTREELNKTTLFDAHRALQAKMVDFAGWSMPLQYSGVIDEYRAVRERAGLFDVSHMGRIRLSGEEALPLLQWVTTNDASRLDEGQAHYSMVCNPNGGVKDDVFLYRLGAQDYLLCVNASNREKIMQWLEEQRQVTVRQKLTIIDSSFEITQLALQGPKSRTILERLTGSSLAALGMRQCRKYSIADSEALIARTGYTGELGYELYLAADQALLIWSQLLEIGRDHGLKPAGLGARDLLRLEMGYFLYGHELTEDTTPIEAGAEWVVAFNKGDFVGAQALQQQRTRGPTRRLIGFELLEKGVPRQGMTVLANGVPTGIVTSGNFSPILQKGIGLAYVAPVNATVGMKLEIDIRGRHLPALVVKPPFYRKSRNAVLDKGTRS